MAEPTVSGAVALDGRALGKRGALTRQRLLEATAQLLETQGVRDLRVVEIARAVGTSPATFYQYFRDVEEAVLALAEEVAEDLTPLRDALTRSWTDDGRGIDAARTMVEAFLESWDRHRAVLRTRNLAAQEGDPRFRAVRNASLMPVTEALADRIAESQRAGRIGPAISPMAAAAAMVAMTERMAVFHRELEDLGITREQLVETTARIIHTTTTGTT